MGPFRVTSQPNLQKNCQLVLWTQKPQKAVTFKETAEEFVFFFYLRKYNNIAQDPDMGKMCGMEKDVCDKADNSR